MGYRDLKTALEFRKRTLEEERASLEQSFQGYDAARARRHAVEREIRDVESALSKRRLPLQQRIRVASPCKASWADMAGDERKRFCGKCQKHVYNLSAMTADEVEALIYETEGKLCARFYQRKDGTILTADCAVGVRRRRRRVVVAGGAVALSLAAVAAFGVTTRMGGVAPIPEQGEFPEVMGTVAAIDSPTDPPPVTHPVRAKARVRGAVVAAPEPKAR